MTPEEILSKKNWSSEYPNYMSESEILSAMDEYAQQMSIAFAEWIDIKVNDNLLAKVRAESSSFYGKWIYSGENEYEYVTTAELYTKFLESIQ